MLLPFTSNHNGWNFVFTHNTHIHTQAEGLWSCISFYHLQATIKDGILFSHKHTHQSNQIKREYVDPLQIHIQPFTNYCSGKDGPTNISIL